MSEVTINDQGYEVDGILFDKDGTLLDFAELWLRWAQQWIHHVIDAGRQVQVDASLLGKAIGYDLDRNRWDPIGPLAIGSMDDLESLLSSCLYAKGMPWNEAMTLVVQSRESADASINWKNHLKPTPGLESFLHQLRYASIPLGVVTSDDTERARGHLQDLGIAKYFGCVIGHDAVQRGKPFPDMAREACRQLDIRPEKTMIIGDSNGDMMTGKNAHMLTSIGIVPEQIETFRHLKDADHLIRDYKNIKVLSKKEGDIL